MSNVVVRNAFLFICLLIIILLFIPGCYVKNLHETYTTISIEEHFKDINIENSDLIIEDVISGDVYNITIKEHKEHIIDELKSSVRVEEYPETDAIYIISIDGRTFTILNDAILKCADSDYIYINWDIQKTVEDCIVKDTLQLLQEKAVEVIYSWDLGDVTIDSFTSDSKEISKILSNLLKQEYVRYFGEGDQSVVNRLEAKSNDDLQLIINDYYILIGNLVFLPQEAYGVFMDDLWNSDTLIHKK